MKGVSCGFAGLRAACRNCRAYGCCWLAGRGDASGPLRQAFAARVQSIEAQEGLAVEEL